jgi:2-dehydro-3-deoxyphosphooctonate aldolase (KDO 8-P synthase)
VSEVVHISDEVVVGDGRLAVIAGPCVYESEALAFEIAGTVRDLCRELGLPFVFKASFDKANRTASSSFRSVGMIEALRGIGAVREQLEVPVLTDVHESAQVEVVARHVDVLQIPAFLCRQTDLLTAAGASGCAVNIKKGQFLAPEDMRFAAEKTGSTRVLLTERGTTFGYRDLIVDFRSLAKLREVVPVVFDLTHSVQSPGGASGRSGGDRELAFPLARAATAVGVDALFLETHPDPDRAPSDSATMLPLGRLREVLEGCLAIHDAWTRLRAPLGQR